MQKATCLVHAQTVCLTSKCGNVCQEMSWKCSSPCRRSLGRGTVWNPHCFLGFQACTCWRTEVWTHSFIGERRFEEIGGIRFYTDIKSLSVQCVKIYCYWESNFVHPAVHCVTVFGSQSGLVNLRCRMKITRAEVHLCPLCRVSVEEVSAWIHTQLRGPVYCLCIRFIFLQTAWALNIDLYMTIFLGCVVLLMSSDNYTVMREAVRGINSMLLNKIQIK